MIHAEVVKMIEPPKVRMTDVCRARVFKRFPKLLKLIQL